MKARWNPEQDAYIIELDGKTYCSLDGDEWIDPNTGENDAPEGPIDLIGGPRDSDVVL